MKAGIVTDSTADRMRKAALVFLLVLHAAFLARHIGRFPNVFLDEANGMYDSWCMAFFGVDSNLMRFPVYLQGFTGQGQSVFYAAAAGLSMRLFGYTLFAYRLPLILISTLHLLLLAAAVTKREGQGTAVWITAAVGLSPYLLDAARFGMDCNVSPFLYSTGALLLYLGVTEEKNRGKRTGLLLAGAVFFALTAYSYNVSWIVMPVCLPVMGIWLCLSGRLTVRELLLTAAVMLLAAAPVLIFAVRSNIPSLNQTVKILWWTSPALPNGRAAQSVVDFSPGPVRAIWQNLYNGWKMFADGTDRLSWNSVGSIGPYYRFVLPFFLAGFARLIVRAGKRDAGAIILLSELAGVLPACLVITPNYNHWMFLHVPVLVTAGAGMVWILRELKSMGAKRIFAAAMAATYLLSAFTFFRLYFDGSRNTGWDSGGREKLLALEADARDRVYFVSDQTFFLYQMRFYLPVSPYEFQETKDHPYSETEFWMADSYSNFRRLPPPEETDTADMDTADNTLYLIQEAYLEEYRGLLASLDEKPSLVLNGVCYHVYEDL